jgi:tRNA(fMet)-specific endonuclease VapC
VGTLVDTSILIAAERGQLDPKLLQAENDDEPLVIAAITAAELLHGVHRAKSAAGRVRTGRNAERWIGLFTAVPFDLDVARIHAHVSADLATSGATVGAHDLIIAATALSLEYRIATRDLRSFPKIVGLEVVRW